MYAVDKRLVHDLLQFPARHILDIRGQAADHLILVCIIVPFDGSDLIGRRFRDLLVYDYYISFRILQFQLKPVKLFCVKQFITYTIDAVKAIVEQL